MLLKCQNVIRKYFCSVLPRVILKVGKYKRKWTKQLLNNRFTSSIAWGYLTIFRGEIEGKFWEGVAREGNFPLDSPTPIS